MKTFTRWVAALLMGFIAITASASPANPQLGVDYQAVPAPQDAEAGKQVEIIEFFGYFCPHCYSLDTPITNWARQHKDKVLLRRVHVKFNDSMNVQQRMFYTLAAMGELTNSFHHKVFKAMQEDRFPFKSDVQVFRWMEENGIDRAKFEEMYRSPYVDALCAQSIDMMNAFKLDGVPMLIVDGKYMTSLAIVSDGNKADMSEMEAVNATVKVLDNLVNRTLKERNTKK